MTSGYPQTARRADLLLQWLNARAFGSSSQLKDAVEYLYGPDVRYYEVALRLAALGYAEFDWEGPDLRWNAVPSSCYRMSRRGAQFLGVCGLLPGEVRTALAEARVTIETDTEMFIEDEPIARQLVVDSTRARRILDEFGVVTAYTAYNDLRLRLPSVSGLLSAGDPVDVPELAERFNPVTGRFEDEAELRWPFHAGLYRVLGYPRSTYFWLSTTDPSRPLCRLIDRTIGMWGANIDGPAQKYSMRGGRLTVPAFPTLPVLYERMLYFSGARCAARTKVEITFDHVDGDVVGALLQKLPLQRRGHESNSGH